MDKLEHRIEQIEKFASQCYEDGERYSAFISGAIWADNNPVNVWHDANVRPNENSEILIQWNIERNSGYESYYTDSIENWDRFVERHGVSRWAYIDNLLPKKFGNSEQLKGGKQ